MNSPTEFTPPGDVGCSASVSFSSCLRKSSHSMGTAVRFSGIDAPGLNLGPAEYAGTSWIAREVTSDGDRIAARASAGTAYCLSTENVTLELVGCGSILSTTPTATPRIRTSSPTNRPLASAKYAEYMLFSTSFHSFLPTRKEATASVSTRLIAVAFRRVRRLMFTARRKCGGWAGEWCESAGSRAGGRGAG